ncbi:MAG: hypothetical protein M3281_07720, partial [Chloroflexota bacterium]|nr:hypothetical protein [Chloroflexota bacterium]
PITCVTRNVYGPSGVRMPALPRGRQSQVSQDEHVSPSGRQNHGLISLAPALDSPKETRQTFDPG